MAAAPYTRDAQQQAENELRDVVNAVRRRTRTRLDENLPTDHRLAVVYRVSAGLIGTGLIVFGVLGFSEQIGVFDVGGASVFGLSTNGALAALSVVIGAVLLFGMVRGGNFASSLNIVVGVAFLLSGFLNLALLETPANILNFGLQNVLFSFVVGLVLMICGMYGRVTGRLPRDNPYWRARNPEEDVAYRQARGTPESRELSAGTEREGAAAEARGSRPDEAGGRGSASR